jgi:hypothetical protein
MINPKHFQKVPMLINAIFMLIVLLFVAGISLGIYLFFLLFDAAVKLVSLFIEWI